MVDVTITRITTYEFVNTAIREGKMPFSISFRPGKYILVVDRKDVCELLLKEDLHHDKGDHGPAVIFAIKDYSGKEHLIKLVHKESEEYLSKVMISSFREIKAIKYDDSRRKLVIERSRGEGEATSDHENRRRRK